LALIEQFKINPTRFSRRLSENLCVLASGWECNQVMARRNGRFRLCV